MKPGVMRRLKRTWKTHSIACQNVSKLLNGFAPFSCPLNFPPNTCMPSSAKITMNRKSRTRRLAIALIELMRETTRFRSDVQYLFHQISHRFSFRLTASE